MALPNPANAANQARQELDRLWASLRPKVTTLSTDLDRWKQKRTQTRKDCEKRLEEARRRRNRIRVKVKELVKDHERIKSSIGAATASDKESEQLSTMMALLKEYSDAIQKEQREDKRAQSNLQNEVANLQRKIEETQALHSQDAHLAEADMEKEHQEQEKLLEEVQALMKKVHETQMKVVRAAKA